MVETFLGVQVLSLLFAIFMMYLVSLHYKRGNLGKKELVFWTATWITFSIFTLTPHLLSPLLTRLSFVRAMDLLMVVAFMILTYAMFMDHIAIRDLYKKLNDLISKEAKAKASKP